MNFCSEWTADFNVVNVKSRGETGIEIKLVNSIQKIHAAGLKQVSEILSICKLFSLTLFGHGGSIELKSFRATFIEVWFFWNWEISIFILH